MQPPQNAGRGGNRNGGSGESAVTRDGLNAPDIAAHLRPGDRIVLIKGVPPHDRDVPPSTVRALCLLGGVLKSELLGSTGTLRAATTWDDQRSDPELHLYETVFARDALWAAHFIGGPFPALRQATILTLCASQGVSADRTREEQPGKIVHELREPDDPVAERLTAARGWGWPYYGAIDTTPMFISCVCDATNECGPEILRLPYGARTGQTRTVADAVTHAVSWLLDTMDSDPDGFLSYERAHPGGLENQFWRDSWDALSHADGSLANIASPIAAIQVQAIAYEALLDASVLARQTSMVASENELKARAAALRRGVFGSFWIERGNESFAAVAVDRDPVSGRRRPLATRTSDMGQLLATRLLDGRDEFSRRWRTIICRRVSESTMLGAAGIRTMDTREVRFWEGGYHTGSSWLWDSMIIAQGLRHHGYQAAADDLERRVWSVCQRTGLLPEFARGNGGLEAQLTRRVVDVWQAADERVNRLEQPPQEVQAWTAAALHAAKRRRGYWLGQARQTSHE
jgi:glycogen debranching enzyme